MIWALRSLGTSLELAPLAADVLRRYGEQPDFGADDPDLHFGEIGVLLVAHLVGVPGLEDRLQARIRGNIRNEAWELMSGSAGSILAARVAGFDADADESAAVLVAEWDEATGLWTQTLAGHVSQYLGPAHGLVGNVHALRGFLSDDELRARLEPPLRREARVEGGLANWPPVVGDTLKRLQWCHGAPGIVATVGDLMPLDLMLAGAELTWQAGPLAKGAGLCHGTAGNGYAFLKAYAVTGDELWLERARRFAVHALEQAQRAAVHAVHGRHRRGALRAFLPSRRRAISDNGRLVTHEVKLSSADRVLFPDDGITKGDLFEYYGRVADVIVPHLRDRPFTMKRWREGLPGGAFFQKQAPKGIPSWIETREFRTWPRGGKGESRLVDFPLVNSREALLWMVQMHCIDMNAWYSRVDKPDRPDFVLFDLDPPEEDGAFALCIRVAHYVHAALDELGLESYVKTSGSDGIHVVVPIERRSTFEDTYEFAELLSRQLEAEHPGEVTTEWLKKKRSGVLVDHRQNGHGKTIASVYSVRPKPRRAGLDAAALGRADGGRAPARLPDGGRARAHRRARRPLRARAARVAAARPGAEGDLRDRRRRLGRGLVDRDRRRDARARARDLRLGALGEPRGARRGAVAARRAAPAARADAAGGSAAEGRLHGRQVVRRPRQPGGRGGDGRGGLPRDRGPQRRQRHRGAARLVLRRRISLLGATATRRSRTSAG